MPDAHRGAPLAQPLVDAVEMDEPALHAAVEARYGPATSDDWNRTWQQVRSLARLLTEAARHGRDHWTEEQRAAHQHLPEESLQALQQEDLRLRLSAHDDYRQQCMRELHRIVRNGAYAVYRWLCSYAPWSATPCWTVTPWSA